jgi:hypothetical protein
MRTKTIGIHNIREICEVVDATLVKKERALTTLMLFYNALAMM